MNARRCIKCGTPEGANLGRCSHGGYCEFNAHDVDVTWNKAERPYCDQCGRAVRKTFDGTWLHE